MEAERARKLSMVALACGVLGTLGAVWLYWLVLPGVALGVAAVVLGLLARRAGPSEPAIAAVVATLLVPSVLFIVDEAESYGRDCVLDPTDC